MAIRVTTTTMNTDSRPTNPLLCRIEIPEWALEKTDRVKYSQLAWSFKWVLPPDSDSQQREGNTFWAGRERH